jgi:penicillin V acylase-like amidase (Ntn superfamily)
MIIQYSEINFSNKGDDMALQKKSFKQFKINLLIAGLMAGFAVQSADACTRAVYIGPDNVVVTGRSMDWSENMNSNLWIMPRGIEQNGAAGPNSIKWKSKYGSVIATAYDIATADGMNEKGLVINVLFLAKSDFGNVGNKPTLSVVQWGQYALDNFASVNEAVAGLKSEPFRIVAPTLPDGTVATVHLSISDPTGDSAIFEYLDGKQVIHHGKQYRVMTNDPSYSAQLSINEYWKNVGGLNFLPGTVSPADRFARVSFMVSTLPTTIDKAYASALPDQSLQTQASLGMLGAIRSVSVPLGEGIKGAPDIASTIWRTISDQKNKVYYFDSATSPNAFWIDLKQVDFSKDAPVKKLTIAAGKMFSGNAVKLFEPAKLFTPLVAKPK